MKLQHFACLRLRQSMIAVEVSDVIHENHGFNHGPQLWGLSDISDGVELQLVAVWAAAKSHRDHFDKLGQICGNKHIREVVPLNKMRLVT